MADDPFANDTQQPATDADDPFAAPKISKTESFMRGLPEGAAFGYDDKLGFDKEAREASRKANPLTHFAGEAVGSILPMAAATVLPTGAGQAAAGTRAAYLLSRGAGLLRSALVPASEAKTIGQTALQGTKLGTVYGGLSGSGHADVDPEDTWASSLLKRGKGALLGAGTGAVAGTLLGAGAHAAGDFVSKAYPVVADLFRAKSTPELQGIRDILREMGYDKYTVADLARLRANLADPAQAQRYANLNLIEALEARPLQPSAITGELQMPVKVSPSLREHAQDMANTAGIGRAEAVEAFATRKNEMSGNIQRDIDTFFGTGNAQADEAALQAQKQALDRRYSRIKAKPLQSIEDLGVAAQQIPEFQSALNDAAKNDFIRMMAEGGSSAEWSKPWSAGDLGKTIQTLSPQNILDIHHSLVLNAKPSPLTGPTSESMMAGKMKDWFSNWVDNQFRGHQKLRRDYKMFKRTMEADEMGSSLPINTGGADHPSLIFLDNSLKDLAAAQKVYDKAQQGALASNLKYQFGQRKTKPSQAALNDAQGYVDQAQGVVDAFRKAWGDRFKQELTASVSGPNPIVGKMMTPEAKSRILRVLGPDKGQAFIESLFNKKQQIDWSKTLFGGPDTAYKLARNQKKESLGDLVSNVAHGKLGSAWSNVRDIGSSRFKQSRADQGNALLSRQGPGPVGNVLDHVMSRMGEAERIATPFTSAALKTVGPAADVIPGYEGQTRPFPPYRQ